MIPFFRRIRQGLLSNNKFSKYILYAVGEIILVVIGILIALQINSWNREQENRKQEQQILSQLSKEYRSNLSQIEDKIEIRNEVLSSCFSLLQYIKEDPATVSGDSLDAHLFRISIRPTFDPELSVSNELINSGKLYLLENLDLRNKVSAFSSSLSELEEEETAIFILTEERLIPFLIENYQIGRMMMVLLDDEELRAKLTMGSLTQYENMMTLVPQADFTPLLKNPDFQDYLLQMISYTAYTNEQSEGVKEKIKDIIATIENEIDD
ncbi:DUF6090 family protein [Salinimicrobium soli]|uniref:DUF6090 family protein n=1 Tax=Salinimicrobium soli TaxID=1254399 RepID=UPI003AABB3CF